MSDGVRTALHWLAFGLLVTCVTAHAGLTAHSPPLWPYTDLAAALGTPLSDEGARGAGLWVPAMAVATFAIGLRAWLGGVVPGGLATLVAGAVMTGPPLLLVRQGLPHDALVALLLTPALALSLRAERVPVALLLLAAGITCFTPRINRRTCLPPKILSKYRQKSKIWNSQDVESIIF